MNIERFELEFWLNPLDDKAKYNFGSSCCKPVTVSEMLDLTGTDQEAFFREIESMSLHYGYFEGMPRLKQAIAGLYTQAVTPEMVLCVHVVPGPIPLCVRLCVNLGTTWCASCPAISSTTPFLRRWAVRFVSSTAVQGRSTPLI